MFSAFRVRMGRAPAMLEGVRVGVCWGGNSSRGLHSGDGGVGSGVSGLCVGGVSGSLGAVGVPLDVGRFAAGVCWLPAVGDGAGRSAGGSLAGVCGSSGGGREARVAVPGAVWDGGRVWATWWGMGREGCGAGLACVMLVYVSACSGALVWSRVGRNVWRRRLPLSAAAARISQMRVRI